MPFLVAEKQGAWLESQDPWADSSESTRPWRSRVRITNPTGEAPELHPEAMFEQSANAYD